MAAAVGRGGTIVLYAHFYAYTGGPLADVDGVAAEILFGGTPVATPTVERTGTGAYLVRWQTPGDAQLGSYQVRWSGTMQGSPVELTESFNVLATGVGQAGNVTVVISVSDVRGLTNVSVNADQIRRAQSVVEMISGRSVAHLTGINMKWMRLAVAYQAVWMEAHPEVFSTMDVDSVNQDGLMVKFREDREANLLAPLARAALKRMSQRNPNRSMSVNSTFAQVTPRENWKPLR